MFTRKAREMALRQLRQRCRQLLAESGLQIPKPFDINTFCRDFSESRGRDIQLLPGIVPQGASAVWVATHTTDYIGYKRETSALHQVHLILHEIGHIICRHNMDSMMSAAASRLMLPTLDPAMVNRILYRSNYSQTEEKEAETIASLILRHVERSPQKLPQSLTGHNAEVLDRINESLMGRQKTAW